MSPASQGCLEVERYVGNCLISGRSGKHLQDNYRMPKQHQQPWANGIPLMAMAALQTRRSQQPDQQQQSSRVPLARLAVHTQGAPLILSGHRYNNNRPTNNANNINNSKKIQSNPVQQQQDTLSVTSDESSNSQNSENCLPRIIKPRKRRKKDRKPAANVQPEPEQKLPQQTRQQQKTVVKVDEPKPKPPTIYSNNNSRPRIPPNNFAPKSTHYHQQRHHHQPPKPSQVLQYPPSNPDCPYHNPAALCRCDYWPQHPPPHPAHHQQQYQHSQTVYLSSMDYVLRRSWSDPSSYYPPHPQSPERDEEIVPNNLPRDVGVIGDRACQRSVWHGSDAASSISSASSSCSTTSSGSSSSSSSSSLTCGSQPPSPGVHQSLEVTTEIVTSPNGHRDLEIKFYSAPAQEEHEELSEEDLLDDNLEMFAFPDDEEYGDIWSYHETKLRRDFRTLLQAEE